MESRAKYDQRNSVFDSQSRAISTEISTLKSELAVLEKARTAARNELSRLLDESKLEKDDKVREAQQKRIDELRKLLGDYRRGQDGVFDRQRDDLKSRIQLLRQEEDNVHKQRLQNQLDFEQERKKKDAEAAQRRIALEKAVGEARLAALDRAEKESKAFFENLLVSQGRVLIGNMQSSFSGMKAMSSASVAKLRSLLSSGTYSTTSRGYSMAGSGVLNAEQMRQKKQESYQSNVVKYLKEIVDKYGLDGSQAMEYGLI